MNTLDVEYITPSLFKRLMQNPGAVFGLCLLLGISLMAFAGPLISGYSYYEINLRAKNQPPNLHHWFGTDDLGRDLFTRVWYGARISLSIGIAAALIDVIYGVLWGSIAAYAGGKAEEFMMRLADILYSLPYLLVVIILSLVLGSGFFSILAAMTIFGWITMARIVRAQVRQLKEQGYVQAAVVLGAGFPHILIKHLIPNAMGPIIVTLTTSIPSAIFVEAFLSFLGLGIQAPMSSWGSMAHDGLPALAFYPWRLFFPAFAISLTMLAFNLIGDALSTLFDFRETL
jgi:oligopeptide transport system permease protein